jgi:hypothetical protein
VLAFANPDRITPADAEAAAERLRKPTSNSPGHYATGTGAVSDSLLACALPADDRTACIRMLLSNASSPYEGSRNRSSCLLTAANLSDNLDNSDRREFFDAALSFSATPRLRSPTSSTRR